MAAAAASAAALFKEGSFSFFSFVFPFTIFSFCSPMTTSSFLVEASISAATPPLLEPCDFHAEDDDGGEDSQGNLATWIALEPAKQPILADASAAHLNVHSSANDVALNETNLPPAPTTFGAAANIAGGVACRAVGGTANHDVLIVARMKVTTNAGGGNRCAIRTRGRVVGRVAANCSNDGALFAAIVITPTNSTELVFVLAGENGAVNASAVDVGAAAAVHGGITCVAATPSHAILGTNDGTMLAVAAFARTSVSVLTDAGSGVVGRLVGAAAAFVGASTATTQPAVRDVAVDATAGVLHALHADARVRTWDARGVCEPPSASTSTSAAPQPRIIARWFLSVASDAEQPRAIACAPGGGTVALVSDAAGGARMRFVATSPAGRHDASSATAPLPHATAELGMGRSLAVAVRGNVLLAALACGARVRVVSVASQVASAAQQHNTQATEVVMAEQLGGAGGGAAGVSGLAAGIGAALANTPGNIASVARLVALRVARRGGGGVCARSLLAAVASELGESLAAAVTASTGGGVATQEAASRLVAEMLRKPGGAESAARLVLAYEAAWARLYRPLSFAEDLPGVLRCMGETRFMSAETPLTVLGAAACALACGCEGVDAAFGAEHDDAAADASSASARDAATAAVAAACSLMPPDQARGAETVLSLAIEAITILGAAPLELAMAKSDCTGTDACARLLAEGPSATAAPAVGRSCRAFLVRTASALNSLPEPGGLGAAAEAASRLASLASTSGDAGDMSRGDEAELESVGFMRTIARGLTIVLNATATVVALSCEVRRLPPTLVPLAPRARAVLVAETLPKLLRACTRARAGLWLCETSGGGGSSDGDGTRTWSRRASLASLLLGSRAVAAHSPEHVLHKLLYNLSDSSTSAAAATVPSNDASDLRFHISMLEACALLYPQLGERDMEHLLVLVDELLDDGAELPGCRFIRSLAAGAVARIAASTDAPRADGRSASTLSSEAAPDYLADRAAIIAGGCAGVASPLGATRAHALFRSIQQGIHFEPYAPQSPAGAAGGVGLSLAELEYTETGVRLFERSGLRRPALALAKASLSKAREIQSKLADGDSATPALAAEAARALEHVLPRVLGTCFSLSLKHAEEASDAMEASGWLEKALNYAIEQPVSHACDDLSVLARTVAATPSMWQTLENRALRGVLASRSNPDAGIPAFCESVEEHVWGAIERTASYAPVKVPIDLGEPGECAHAYLLLKRLYDGANDAVSSARSLYRYAARCASAVADLSSMRPGGPSVGGADDKRTWLLCERANALALCASRLDDAASSGAAVHSFAGGGGGATTALTTETADAASGAGSDAIMSPLKRQKNGDGGTLGDDPQDAVLADLETFHPANVAANEVPAAVDASSARALAAVASSEALSCALRLKASLGSAADGTVDALLKRAEALHASMGGDVAALGAGARGAARAAVLARASAKDYAGALALVERLAPPGSSATASGEHEALIVRVLSACAANAVAQTLGTEPDDVASDWAGACSSPDPWDELRDLLEQYESPEKCRAGRLSIAVADAALSAEPRMRLPRWLHDRCGGGSDDDPAGGVGAFGARGADVPGYVRILLKHGRYDEAAELLESRLVLEPRYRVSAIDRKAAERGGVFVPWSLVKASARAMRSAGAHAAASLVESAISNM